MRRDRRDDQPPEQRLVGDTAISSSSLRPSLDDANRPVSSLLRWERHQELRDRVLDYAKARGASTHAVLIEAIQMGLAQLAPAGAECEESNAHRAESADEAPYRRVQGDITIEIRARACRGDDGSWTVEIPRLRSIAPVRVTIAAGKELSSPEIAQAALHVVSTWFDHDADGDRWARGSDAVFPQ